RDWSSDVCSSDLLWREVTEGLQRTTDFLRRFRGQTADRGGRMIAVVAVLFEAERGEHVGLDGIAHTMHLDRDGGGKCRCGHDEKAAQRQCCGHGPVPPCLSKPMVPSSFHGPIVLRRRSGFAGTAPTGGADRPLIYCANQ